MTREDTIKWLESLKTEIGKSEYRALWHYAKAIDMAIEALKENELLQDENSFLKTLCKMYEYEIGGGNE